MAVTVMARYKGYNDQHYNWYFVKYNPDGSVATKGNMKLAGKVKGCTKCHEDAEGDDYAFFNDK